MSDRIFVGRIKELCELNTRYTGSKKEFGVIYGRRRIGKSEIIKEFIKDKNGFIFQAKKDNLYGNLKSFSYELNRYIGSKGNYVYESWQEALDTLSQYASGERFVLAIDEYPYIVEQDGSFPSVLQEFIDNAGENIFLIISGSDVSMLKNEIKNHASPLYKRRTFEMAVTQMPFREALGFFTGCDNDTKSKYLALMSTFPYYLQAIDTSLSFEENVRNLLFNQYGAFFTLPDQLLSNSTKVQDVYNAILNAIAHRRRTNKEISDYIHEEESKVSKYMLTLLESEIVIKCETFMGNKKTLYYDIADPLLKFWYMFIFDNQERIKTNGAITFEKYKNEINQFISLGFEEVCRLYLQQLNEEGKLSDIFPKPKIYKAEKSILGRSVEIDGLSLSDNTLLVIECKFRNCVFDYGMLRHLEESVTVFPDKYEKAYYLFSKSGFSDEVKALKDNRIHLFDLNGIFA